MTRVRPRPAPALGHRPHAADAAQPARDGLHVRLPADAPACCSTRSTAMRGSRRWNRGRRGPLRAVYTPSIGISGWPPRATRTLVFGSPAPATGPAQARARHAAADARSTSAAWLIGAALTGCLAVVLLFAVAVPVFGVDVYAPKLPEAVVTLALGVRLPRRARCGRRLARQARPSRPCPVAQLTFLPLAFITGIFFPLDNAPDWVVADRPRLSALPHRERVRRLASCHRTPAAAGRARDLRGRSPSGA